MPRQASEPIRTLRISEIRSKLPPSLRRDPLGAAAWKALEGLGEGEALELPGRGREARRIGRAVARFGRERGWELKAFSSGDTCYVARLK
jgi:hypothetical protein